ncbi:MAG: ferredoxin [Betaproteobacteria bacterium HGW-Betaproteobacteria-1]|jgi:(2Fe-2S) ferredoxin|nr:MAG: ferredoxin [Betaproteobacteria bacterium HGW-Betaproteobacteria-1]
MPKPLKHVFVCNQARPAGHPRGSCQAKGGNDIVQAFWQQAQARNLWDKFSVTYSGCLGPCDSGPNVLVYPDAVMYSGVSKEDVVEIIDKHLLGDEVVERLKAPESVW